MRNEYVNLKYFLPQWEQQFNKDQWSKYNNFYHNHIDESNPFEDANVKAFKLQKGNDLRKFIHLCVTDGKHMPIFNYERNCYDSSCVG